MRFISKLITSAFVHTSIVPDLTENSKKEALKTNTSFNIGRAKTRIFIHMDLPPAISAKTFVPVLKRSDTFSK